MKITKKLHEELLVFNRTYRKPNKERPLTIEEYARYVYGKGLPESRSVKLGSKKPLIFNGVPTWANTTTHIPSVTPNTYIAVKNSIMERLDNESDEVRKEILDKKNRIALPYSKGAYQYITDADLATCLGRKL